jgi:hypothetical protein
VVERRLPLVITNGYELPPPQRHRAHGELTEDSTILLPTRNSEEPYFSQVISLVIHFISASSTLEDLMVTMSLLIRSIPLGEPITKGRSQAVNRQQFMSFIASSNLGLKYIQAQLNIMRSAQSGRSALAVAFRRRGF